MLPQFAGSGFIALVANHIYCSSKRTTHINYKFYSGKDKASVESQVLSNKQNTSDVQKYEIVKWFDYTTETQKLRLQGQRVIEGESFK